MNPQARTKTPVWLWAVPVFSCGLLAAASPFAIAVKTRSAAAWRWTVAVAALSFAGFALLGSPPEDTTTMRTTVGMLCAAAAMMIGAVWSSVKWPEVAAASRTSIPPVATSSTAGNASAIAAVEAARRKRREAREIAARDPQMARELSIGRPDLARHFDDGGLVDVNSAPAEVFVHAFGWPTEVADGIVRARDTVGRFQAAEDLVLLAGVGQVAFDAVQDRLLLL